MTKTSRPAVSGAQALAWRSERHFLDPVGSASAAEVVGRLGAVLSMDEARAEMAVRTRRTASQPGELARALETGTVIKAFAFRGSMHYLSAEDGGIYLALRCAGRQWELKSWVEHYGLRPADWPDFRAAVREALAPGPATIAELGAALTRQRAYRHLEPIFADGAWTLVKPLTWQGDMSFGPSRDGEATFQRLDANPHWRGIPDLEEAGPRAVLAYLHSYGPASVDHLHYWLGSGLSAGRRRIERWVSDLSDRLTQVALDGADTLVESADLDELLAARPGSAVRMLPGHDQWVIGPGTRDTLITPAPLRDLMTRKANPLIVGGVVSGTWLQKGDSLSVTWLGPAPRPTAAIEAEVARLGAILGRELEVDWVS